jgi:hypothetical protein
VRISLPTRPNSPRHIVRLVAQEQSISTCLTHYGQYSHSFKVQPFSELPVIPLPRPQFASLDRATGTCDGIAFPPMPPNTRMAVSGLQQNPRFALIPFRLRARRYSFPFPKEREKARAKPACQRWQHGGSIVWISSKGMMWFAKRTHEVADAHVHRMLFYF